MYLHFIPFKSKSFIFDLSLIYKNRTLQRKFGILQTDNLANHPIIYKINNRIHREEQERETKTKICKRKYLDRNYKRRRKRVKKIVFSPFRTLPAIIGTITEWYKNNKIHRTEKDKKGLTLPARVWDHTKEWWKNGKRHRDDKIRKNITLPAVETFILKEWWNNGKRHRDDQGDTIDKYVDPQVYNYYYGEGHVFSRECLEKPVVKYEDYTLPAVIQVNYGVDENKERWVNGVCKRTKRYCYTCLHCHYKYN